MRLGDLEIANFYCWLENNIYNTPHHRGYELKADISSIRRLENLVDRRQQLTEKTVAKHLPDIIGISSSSSGGEVLIPEGWNEKRISFMLEIRRKVNSTKVVIEYIQGYSEYFEPSSIYRTTPRIQDLLDPNCLLHVNSITTVDVIKGSKIHTTVRDRINIIKSFDGDDIFEIDSVDGLVKVRAHDFFEDKFMAGINANSTSDRVTDEGEVNNMAYDSSTAYVSEIINSISRGKRARKNATTLSGMDDGLVLEDIVEDLAPKELTAFGFMSHLYMVYREIGRTSFTLLDLEDLDPMLNHKTTFIDIDDTRTDSILRRAMDGPFDSSLLSTEHLSDTSQPTIENRLAIEIFSSFLPMMLSKSITGGDLTIGNDPDVLREPIAMFTNASSGFNEVFATPASMDDLSLYADTVLLPKLTNKIGDMERYFYAKCTFSLFGGTTIMISVNFGEPEVFRYNTSANGLYSPSMDTRANKLNTRENIDGLLECISN